MGIDGINMNPQTHVEVDFYRKDPAIGGNGVK